MTDMNDCDRRNGESDGRMLQGEQNAMQATRAVGDLLARAGTRRQRAVRPSERSAFYLGVEMQR